MSWPSTAANGWRGARMEPVWSRHREIRMRSMTWFGLPAKTLKTVPSRAFPIRTRFLEDWTSRDFLLLAATAAWIAARQLARTLSNDRLLLPRHAFSVLNG